MAEKIEKPDRADAVLHPYIQYHKSRIESLLAVIQLEHQGVPVEPDGFRIRELAAWSFESYPSLFDSLGSLSSFCNLNCRFCYERGNPLPYERTILSPAEAATRIRYFRSEVKRGLPHFQRRLYKEPFTNRHLLTILAMVRQADPEAEISLTTNGSALTAEVVRELREFLPLNISISLNSSRPGQRREIMGDRESEVAIRAGQLLRENGLAFNGSIVAWPSLAMEDIHQTIRFLDAHHARMIRVTLPGYSRFFASREPFATNTVWRELVAALKPLRQELDTPLVILPSLYHTPALLPSVEGAIRSSPAGRGGIRPDDLIRTINDRPVSCRSEAKQLLREAHQDPELRLTIARGDREFELRLENSQAGGQHYPYQPPGYRPSSAYPFGIVLIDDFDPQWLWQALAPLAEQSYRNVVLMTSQIMEPVVGSLLENHPDLESLLGETNLYLWIPEHRYWGGNIIMGDLYTCSDYLQAIGDFQRQHGIRPDLVIIPGSFTYNRNSDLLGTSYSSIEIASNIPVHVFPCPHLTL